MADTLMLQKLFEGHQNTLISELTKARSIPHATLAGDGAEGVWADMLSRHLPKRYKVCRGLIIDSRGDVSEQIDLIIHDAQYCPVFNESQGTRFVPAESVYAVFEVKQELTAPYLRAAGAKAASVRDLHRTSAKIVDRGTVRDPRPLPPILAGVVALEASWTDGLGESFREHVAALSGSARLDIGCAANAGEFEWIPDGGTGSLRIGAPELALARFFLRLVDRLQQLGTVPAIHWDAYITQIA